MWEYFLVFAVGYLMAIGSVILLVRFLLKQFTRRFKK